MSWRRTKRTESKTFKVYLKINMLNNEIKAFFLLQIKAQNKSLWMLSALFF